MKKIKWVSGVFLVFFNVVFAQQPAKKEALWYELLNKTNTVYMQNGAQAKKTMDSLYPILSKRGNDSLLGLYYRVNSNISSNQLEKEKAIRYIDQSIAYFKKANNPKGVVLSSMNKGNLYFMKGDTKSAMEIYSKALALANKNSLVYEIGVLNKNIGVIFFNQNKVKEALAQYEKAVVQFLKINNKKELAAAYTNIGNVYYDQYDSKNALLNYKKAMTLTLEVKDTVNLAKLYNNIGSVYVDDEKDTLKGLSYLVRSLQLKEKLQDNEALIFQYENIATVYIGQKNYDLAASYLNKALEMALKSGNKEELKEIYENYALLYEGKKDFKKAYGYFRLHAKEKDTLLNIENLKAVEEIKTKYQTAEKEKIILQQEVNSKRKNIWLLTISLLAVFTSLIGFLIYRQQKLKNKQQQQEFQLQSAIAQIEAQNQLQEQRLSISRDLHDNIGAQLTFVISSVDNLKYGNKITDSKITNQLTKISDFTKSTIVELRDTIWAMNTNEFTFDDLRSRIFNFIEKAQSAKEDIQFVFQVDDNLKDRKFSSIVGINLYRTMQEAVNNAVKYADAGEISIKVTSHEGRTQIDIRDNGKGFDPETIDHGNGLYNMKKRIEEVGGTIAINSKVNEGTTISISI